MDFKPFIEGLQSDLKRARTDIPNIVKRVNYSIRQCHSVLSIFKKSVLANGFESIEKEIDAVSQARHEGFGRARGYFKDHPVIYENFEKWAKKQDSVPNQ